MHSYLNPSAQSFCSTPLGSFSLVNSKWDEPVRIEGASDFDILQLSLLPLPRSSKARFSELWPTARFENFGPISLLPAGQRVYCESEIRHLKSVFCMFNHGELESLLEEKIQWPHYPLEKLLDISSPRLRSLLHLLGGELSSPGLSNAKMLELLTESIGIELSRFLEKSKTSQVYGGLSARNLQLIEARVCEELIPPTLTELAALCDLSVRHLSRAFQISKGCSPGAYITEWRIKHAKRLLASGASVKATAYSLGFTEPSNFSLAFRRETGEAPSKYRVKCRD